MPTLLAKKAQTESPIATDDASHAQLVADPKVDTSRFSDPHAPIVTASASSGFGVGTSSGFGSSAPSGFNSTSGGFGSGSSNSMGSVGTSNMNVSTGNQPVLTGAGSNAAQGADVLVANDNTDWINKKWRPVMGWMYMLVCVCDFTLFPILWSILQALSHGSVTAQWQPLTLQGAGLFHVAMGAVLGIAAYGRTKEKISGTS